MFVSQILAWVSALMCLMEVLRFAARISRIKPLNRFFHKCHIPCGILLLLSGGLHGLLSGNLPEAGLGEMEVAPVLFTANWGTACFLCAILLAGSYLLRKKLPQKWLPVHRVFTLLIVVFLVLHLTDVGIRLPQRWATAPSLPEMETVSPSPSEEPAAVPTARPTAKPTARPTPEPVPQATETPSPSPEVSQEPESSASPSGTGLVDGVYTGTGQGRNGLITVRVTVASGEIKEIQVVGHNETPKYYSSAQNVIGSILSSQSAEVDAVTGATLSSEGIKAAVADALGQ